MNWPQNEDGDVFRLLEEDGFDFNLEVKIDFNIDFDHWPISDEALQFLKDSYPNGVLVYPDEDDFAEGIDKGYYSFIVTSKLSYDFVIDMQEKVSRETAAFGGVCKSWGVMG
ncbi:MAG: ribonuclease E inhibitor RraB [Pseudomonadales bacterium]|nr:ribonuclease E inhibitor RraB [Pseudomonadales bacterium]